MREMMKALKYMEEEYGAINMLRLSEEWINKWLGSRKKNVPEAVLKELLQLKNDIESGKLAVPVEYVSREEGKGED